MGSQVSKLSRFLTMTQTHKFPLQGCGPARANWDRLGIPLGDPGLRGRVRWRGLWPAEMGGPSQGLGLGWADCFGPLLCGTDGEMPTGDGFRLKGGFHLDNNQLVGTEIYEL